MDADGQVVHTGGGEARPYDALLVAVGANQVAPYEHVSTFHDAEADEVFHGVIQDIEMGYAKGSPSSSPSGPCGRCRSTSSR